MHYSSRTTWVLLLARVKAEVKVEQQTCLNKLACDVRPALHCIAVAWHQAGFIPCKPTPHRDKEAKMIPHQLPVDMFHVSLPPS